MPQQLIYTSAPRGLVAGRSGYCTVARSNGMREPLMLRLEQLSYYHHLSLSGGQERPIFAYRVIDIRGTRFHVLSRIQDAGLDFTGRTNFIAHHLVMGAEEIAQFATPPVIFRNWPGWVNAWAKEPQILDREDWSSLISLSGQTSLPAQTWQGVTGDAVNAFGFLESRGNVSFLVENQTDETLLSLFSESVELLEVRDVHREFRSAAWQYTFTTSMQEQDNPADFRWRCLHSNTPAAMKFAGPDCRPVSSVRTIRCTDEEVALARNGRSMPRFLVQPSDLRITEGETVRLQAQAEGVPIPSYQWFSVDKAQNGQAIEGQTGPEITLNNLQIGVSRFVLRASNSAGDAVSNPVTVSVEQKVRLASIGRVNSPNPQTSHKRSESDIERQRKKIEVQQAEELYRKKQKIRQVLIVAAAIAIIAVAGAAFFLRRPAAPILSISMTTNNQQRELTWPVVPRARSYNVQWSTHKNGPYATLTNTLNNSWILSSPTDGITKYYRVSALAFGLESTNSTEMAYSPQDVPKQDETTPFSRPHAPSLPPAESFSLPDGWKKQDIGLVSNARAEFIAPKFQLSGTAHELTNGIFFVYTNIGNTWTNFDVKISTNNNSSCCYGVMAREFTNLNSRFSFIGISSNRVFYASESTNFFVPSPILAESIEICLTRTTKNKIAVIWRGVTNNVGGDHDIGTNFLVGFSIGSGSLTKAQFELIQK